MARHKTRKQEFRKVSEHAKPAASPVFSLGWVETHAVWTALGIIVASLAIRTYFAVTYHLNPDEGFHFLFSHQPSLADVRLETLEAIHTYPPLYVFILHLWMKVFGDSELALRLPALLSGTVFLGVAFLWVRRLLGLTAAMATLILLAFSPGIISLGYEVRNYGLLLASMAVTLYSLERAFDEQSAKWMAVAMLSLYVSILTNYSAAWICVVLGIYVGVRICLRQLGRRLVWHWIGFQAGALLIYAWLYETHIRVLRNSASEAALKDFLKESYYWPGTENPLSFVIRQSVSVVQYLLELRTLSVIAAFLFVGAVAWLATGWDGEVRGGRTTSLLLALPLVLGCGLGLAGLNPYGASRHSAIFEPFLAAGIGYGIALLVGKRVWMVLAMGIALAPPWTNAALRSAWYIPGPEETIEKMEAAVAHLKSLPRGATIIADHASLIELGYYMGRDVYSPYHTRGQTILDFRYAGYRVLCPAAIWSLDPKSFVDGYNYTVVRYQMTPKDVWVFDAGLNNLAAALPKEIPEIRTPNLRWFGDRIAVFQVSN